MSYQTTILCLANSRKYSGHCIAGKEIRNGAIGSWIRPISTRRTGELSDDECSYANGDQPQPFDIMTVSLEKPAADYYQSENYIDDTNTRWQFVRKAKWAEALSAADHVSGALWSYGSDTENGTNDRVPEPIAKKLQGSLYLIRPYGLSIQVITETGEKKIRADFTFNTIPYNFAVTDPITEEHLSGRRDGAYPINDALLCVSLGELFHGYAYKLAAAVLTPDMGA